jgi:hypothetical protein
LANPEFDPERKTALVLDLMAARRAVKDAKSAGEQKAEAEAHRAIDAAKEALGGRGRWTDGAPEPRQAPGKKHRIWCLV